jgi:hypothetical protein
MRRIELLYDNLISCLNEVTVNSDNFVNYVNGSDNIDEPNVISLAESIETQKQIIQKARDQVDFVVDYGDLRNYLNSFREECSDYQYFRENEVFGMISVIQKITSELLESGIDLQEDIDIELFDLNPFLGPILQENFMYFDSNNIEDSLFLINLTEQDAFKEFVDDSQIGTELLFYLLGLIGNNQVTLSDQKYILIKKGYTNKPKTVWSTLCLHILSKGQFIHNTAEYTPTPSITTQSRIQLGRNYHQFTDSIIILSEYNKQNDSIDKYLRAYHLIENFMYKKQIVSLEQSADGRPFSIRDFKRMYDKVSDSEPTVLKFLCNDVMQMTFEDNKTFLEKLLEDWKNVTLLHEAEESEINKLLQILGIVTTKKKPYQYDKIDANNFSAFFAKLVYAFRNSIVHNRETEFHLTHSTLSNHELVSNTPQLIMEKFLMPNLEEIIFHLIIEENQIVWYQNSSLTLWETE